MSDFFGGILDDIRYVGDSVSGFFDEGIGSAVLNGIKQSGYLEEDKPYRTDAGLVDKRVFTGTNFSPRRQHKSTESENFYSTERRWYERLSHFANIVNQTGTKL